MRDTGLNLRVGTISQRSNEAFLFLLSSPQSCRSPLFESTPTRGGLWKAVPASPEGFGLLSLGLCFQVALFGDPEM